MKMIKIFAMLSLFFLTEPTFAQDEQLQEVHSIIYIRKSFDWYVTQYNLWEKELQKDKKKPMSWVNLYTAARMARITSPDKETKDSWNKKAIEVLEPIDKYIKGTFEYWMLKEWQGFSDIQNSDDPEKMLAGRKLIHSYALKAYDIDPNRTETYSALMTTFMEEGNATKAKEISKKWLDSGDLTYGLLTLNYNMLASTSENAILFTQGDNDTYPAWVLQNGENYRNDVTVINIWLAHSNREYRNTVFSKASLPLMNENPESKDDILNHVLANKGEKNIYFTPGFDVNGYDSLAQNIYNVGAALVYCEKFFNNTSFLVDNFENNYLLDQLKNNLQYESWPEKAKEANFGYVSGLFHLLEHYSITDQGNKVKETKKMIVNIISDTQYEEEIMKSLANY